MNIDHLICSAKIAAQSMIDFDTEILKSMKFLQENWEEIGFERLDLPHCYIKNAFDYLEFLPVRDESLYSEKFLSELKAKEAWFRDNYKKETQEVGTKILEKLKELYPFTDK